ncbi:MAG: exodeoxyribonuclease VII small subunit [Kiritimatiellae bacterium]|nr:exodeoxyribonuclease VII small subunit [Kiritimatiellia bacterium]MBP5787347.1 exodeoxyribonuclease VII small subunit [Kiritimatiellia bacterium]MBQ9344941.1 exodeoxyribonuclease VII small subunit [Kiritimatiellia bacterium]
MTDNKKKQTFEENLAELEQLAAEMESGKLPLEELLKKYERGQALIKACSSRLTEVEQKIEQLTATGQTAPLEVQTEVQP